MKLYFLIILLICSILTFAGNDYWQQKADYNIKVTLYPEEKLLNGEVEIHYTNFSNNHLDTIWIHLWPNAYSKYNTAFAKQMLINNNINMDVLDREELGGIGKMNFTIDGIATTLNIQEDRVDIGYLVLESPILPGEEIIIKTPFKVKVPTTVSRMGTDGQNFAITQWFPKVAVYDMTGWHAMPYLDQGEFFSDFGKYHVEITVPENYKVAASGQKTSELVSNKSITRTYDQENIHDFAWFASPDFKVEEETITLQNGKEVIVATYSLTDSEGWQACNALIKNSLLFFSKTIGPYPYDQCTVVEGLLKAGDGMEYPMITVIDATKKTSLLETIVAHEVAHNWWQGMLANNERRFPWIDEGFTTYYEKRYTEEVALYKYDPLSNITDRKIAKFFGLSDFNMDKGEELLIRNEEIMNRHQSVSTSSEELTYFNYGLMIYIKVPQMLAYLEAYLGRKKFDECVQSFYAKHQFKHINPEDIANHFKQCSDKNLDFFFDNWLKSDAVADARLKKVRTLNDTINVEIEQHGEISLPVPIAILTKSDTLTIWTKGEKNSTISLSSIPFQKIIVDPENLSLDINPANNTYKNKWLPKIEKIHPQLFLGLDDGKRSNLFFSPIVTGNAHDKFMVGISIYNRIFPAKHLEWNITPLYAFGTKQANGIFNLSYTQNISNKRRIQIIYDNHFKTFSYNNTSIGGRYINLRPTITVKMLSPDRNKKITQHIHFTHHQNWKELNIQQGVGEPIVKSYISQWVDEIGYEFVKKDIKTPVNASAKFQFNDEHAKIKAETNFKLRYGKIKSYASGRFWISGIIAKQNDFASSSNLGFPPYTSSLAGQNGNRDYLFEHYYLGRSSDEGLLSRQIFMNEGQFKFVDIFQPFLLSSNILASSINLRADFPSKWIPLKLFVDLGLIYSNRFENGSFQTGSLFVFQAGAMISLFKEAIEVYFPFISSSDIKDYYDLQNVKYRQRISFSFDFDKLNPQKVIKGIEL